MVIKQKIQASEFVYFADSLVVLAIQIMPCTHQALGIGANCGSLKFKRYNENHQLE